MNPEMADAQANKELLEQLKQQQEQQRAQALKIQKTLSPKKLIHRTSNLRTLNRRSQTRSQDQQSQNQDSQQQDPSDQEPEAKQGEPDESEEQESQQEEAQREQQEAKEQEQNAVEPTEEESEADKQAQQELEQWLRRVPDDPGGLLREKFRYQSRQRALERAAQYLPITNSKSAGSNDKYDCEKYFTETHLCHGTDRPSWRWPAAIAGRPSLPQPTAPLSTAMKPCSF